MYVIYTCRRKLNYGLLITYTHTHTHTKGICRLLCVGEMESESLERCSEKTLERDMHKTEI